MVLGATTVNGQSHATNWLPKINGSSLDSDVEPLLVRGEIETSLRLPSMCTLWFVDATHELSTKWDIGAPLTVEIGDAASELLSVVGFGDEPPNDFDGEIVTIDGVREGATGFTVIRAYDRLHRLYRGRKTRAFLEVKYGDIARRIASEHGLQAGTIEDPTQATVHDVVYQRDESDGELLERFAAEYGYLLRIDGERKVDFRSPPASSDAPEPGRFGGAEPGQLVLGDDLYDYEISVGASTLVDDVEVRGWDFKTKDAVVGTAKATAGQLAIISPTYSSAEAAAAFPAATFRSATVPMSTPVDVDNAAKAIAAQIRGSFATIHGWSLGNPRLRAGAEVSIGPSGSRFSGKYVITTARHVLTDGSSRTEVMCSGLSDTGLAGAIATDDRPTATDVTNAVPGVIPAIVTTTKDPENLGRVKVKIPFWADPFETGWLRVMQFGAGGKRGTYILPEVGDEVLVSFVHGDMRMGVVLGGLYNGVDKPEQRSATDIYNGEGAINRRSFTSRNGHHLVFSDEDNRDYIELQTADEKILVKLDQTEGTITLDLMGTTPNKDARLVIDHDGNVTINVGNKITLKAQQDIELEAMNVKITAQQALEMSGLQTKLQGQTSLEATSTGTAKFEGTSATFSGTATAELKAPMVRIN